MKKRRHLGDVLAASWPVLETSWGSKTHRSRLEAAGGGCTQLEAGAVAETQGPLLGRIPEGLEY